STLCVCDDLDLYTLSLHDALPISFDHLFTLANMPIKRFGSMLVVKGEFERYLGLLQSAHVEANLAHVMCRNLISVDWRGYVYDRSEEHTSELQSRVDIV